MSTRQSSAPTLLDQLLTALRALLLGGTYPAKTKFLTEREVAEQFGTSRPTANKALSRLVAEGRLEFRQGSGTFVREPRLEYDLRQLVSFTAQATAAGRRPKTELLTFQNLPAGEAPHRVVAALKVSAETELVYVERLRLADDQPVILERRYLVQTSPPRLTKRAAKGSLYSWWTETVGLNLAGAEEVIRAVNLNKAEAKLLRVPAGTAALLVVGTGRSGDGSTLWYEETLYRAEGYEFRYQLGGISAPTQGRLRS